jgi:lipoprotein NlpI
LAGFDAAVTLDPDYASAFNNRGVAHKNLGNTYLAAANFTRAIALDGEKTKPFVNRGLLRFETGNFTRAADNFAAAAALEDNQPAMLTLWAHVSRIRAGGDAGPLKPFATTSPSTDWPGPLVALFMGDTTQDAVLAPYLDAEASPDNGARLQAFFFAGQHQLISGDAQAAAELFWQVIQSGEVRTMAYAGARAELERLGQLEPDQAPLPE